jgi:chemotaxis protein histidine kinase CheA
LDEQDVQALRRVVHQLRGSGGGYGFDAISELAASAEAAIASAADLESIKLKIDELTALLQRVEGFDASQATITTSCQ